MDDIIGFRTFFTHEWKKIMSYQNILLYFLLIILFVIGAEGGLIKFKSYQTNMNTFKETEKEKVRQYTQYTQYCGYGFRLKMSPDPLMIISQYGIYCDLTAAINAGDKLELFDNMRNDELVGSLGQIHYSNLIVFLGCFISLLYGHTIFLNRNQIKYFKTVLGGKKTFSFLLLSRILLLNILFVIVFFSSYLWLLIKGINLFNIYSFIYAASVSLVFTGFIVIGSITSNIKVKRTGLRVAIFIYIFMVFMIPWILNLILNVGSVNLESNKIELKNLTMMMDFEENAKKKVGDYKSGTKVPVDLKKMLKDVLINEYKQLDKSENRLKSKILKNAKLYHLISSLFPVSFLDSLRNEIGSRGYRNLIKFYEYVLKMKRHFTQFYFQKKFFELQNPGRGNVENFVKDNENIYKGYPVLPFYFLVGFTIPILFIIIPLLISYKKFVIILRGSELRGFDFKFQLSSKILNYYMTKDDERKEAIFWHFSNKEIIVDGKILKKPDYIYLPKPSELPTGYVNKKSKLNHNQIINWKNTFTMALQQKKVILTDGLDEIIKLGDKDGISIEWIKDNLKKFNGIILGIGGDISLWFIADNPLNSDDDETIDFIRECNFIQTSS